MSHDNRNHDMTMDPYRTQYAHYKLRVEDTMERHDWLNIANGVELRPSSPSPSVRLLQSGPTAEQRNWERKDACLREFLILTLPPEWKERFMDIPGGGFELWQAIVNEFERESFKEHTELLASFYNIQQDNDESLVKYMDRLKSKVEQLEELGVRISQDSQVMCFLQGLNYYYQPEDLDALLDQNLSLDQALTLIREFVTCKQSNRPIILDAILRQARKLRSPGNSPAGPGGRTAASALKAPAPSGGPASTAAAKGKQGGNSNMTATVTHTGTKGPGAAGGSTSAKARLRKSELRGVHPAEFHRPAYKVVSLHRGLKNETGENNCFLNCTVQALWHLGPFRAHLTSYINEHHNSARMASEPSASGQGRQRSVRIPQGSLMEALCNLFIQYEFTDMPALPATELRASLSYLSDRFKLGKTADANEAFEAILQRIHHEQSHVCPQVQRCLAHEVFGGCMMDQAICNICSATSEPTLRNDFVLYFQATEMLMEAKAIFAKSHPPAEETGIPPAPPRTPTGFAKFFSGNIFPKFHNNHHGKDKGPKQGKHGIPPADDLHYNATHFGQILAKCLAQTQRSCPSRSDVSDSGAASNISSGAVSPAETGPGFRMGGDRLGMPPPRTRYQCNGRATVHQFSLEPPLALALSIGWTQDRESQQTLTDFYNLIAYSIQLSDLFRIHGSANLGSSSGGAGGENTTDGGPLATAVGAEKGPVAGGTSASAGAALSRSGSRDSAMGRLSESDHSASVQDLANPAYVFRGLVCYYGMHYVSIFQSRNRGLYEYLLFDDQTIKNIGDWESVKTKCVKSCYQPVLLLYELETADGKD